MMKTQPDKDQNETDRRTLKRFFERDTEDLTLSKRCVWLPKA